MPIVLHLAPSVATLTMSSTLCGTLPDVAAFDRPCLFFAFSSGGAQMNSYHRTASLVELELTDAEVSQHRNSSILALVSSAYPDLVYRCAHVAQIGPSPSPRFTNYPFTVSIDQLPLIVFAIVASLPLNRLTSTSSLISASVLASGYHTRRYWRSTVLRQQALFGEFLIQRGRRFTARSALLDPLHLCCSDISKGCPFFFACRPSIQALLPISLFAPFAAPHCHGTVFRLSHPSTPPGHFGTHSSKSSLQRPSLTRERQTLAYLGVPYYLRSAAVSAC